MRRIALLAACASVFAAVVAAPSGVGRASAQETAQPAPATPAAKPAPRRFRVAYQDWRGRLERHKLHVGRDLLAQSRGDARAADDAPRPATKRELRRSIHRMQRRWGRWLRHDPQGRAHAFELKVRRQVPSWGKAHLRSIAWCESKNDPRAIGGGGAYRGMYQFSFSTWGVVGGTGDPVAASRWEQTWRAWLLLSRHGSGHWPVCG
jgi:Transglycosylase-like domain